MLNQPKPNEVFKNDKVSLTRYDDNKNVVYKKLLQRKLPQAWYPYYSEFQKEFIHYPKVEEVGEDYFCMEYVPNYGTVEQWIGHNTILKDVPFTKEHGINLLKTLTTAWTDGLEFSKRLPDNLVWVHCDLDLWNVIVLEDFSFMLIDPDSWNIGIGYPSADKGLSNVCRAILNKLGKANV